MHWCYFYLILSFGNPVGLLHTTWSIRAGVAISAILGIGSNIFYVTRMHMMGLKVSIATAIVVCIIVPRIGFEVALIVELTKRTDLERVDEIRWIIEVCFALAGASGAALSAGLCYALRMKRTGYSRTDSKIDVLIVYTINTGVLSSVLCFIGLFTALFVKDGYPFVGALVILTKIYANSVLAVLNSRRHSSKLDESVYELAAFEPAGRAIDEPHRLTFASSARHRSFGQEERGQLGPVESMNAIQIHVSETKAVYHEDGLDLSRTRT
ncbi:hypothetical protein CC2G_002526 [Coprinopsis cinerea AmutBmut pab1-1]|nr:hypothetical protein CC2G_002526 [Coprinopsis cinerea AmutBmut pab1-1]